MRSTLALAAAGWFAVAAFLDEPQTNAGAVDVAVQGLPAVAQTLFVGLTILSLAVVDWKELVAFFNVVPPETGASSDEPAEE
jgi:hypothetical protein